MNWRRVGAAILLAALALWAANSSLLFSPPPDQAPKLIAHRGVHQIYAGSERSAETCRAGEIEPLTHSYIENTLPSIEAAFGYGAAVVEIDVHLTRDEVFAVFHDWTLECQTNGSGVTHQQSFADLKALDLGYGFTPDGATFPLRGSGTGLMPSLGDVLTAELGGPVLINFKSRRRAEGLALAARLRAAPELAGKVFGVYGGGPPTRAALSQVGGLRGFDRRVVTRCLMRYALTGWFGHVPQICRNRLMPMPINAAPFLWGWPHRFEARMKAVGTDLILLGPYAGGSFTTAIDTPEMLARVPRGFGGYIWTDRIEVIGPALKALYPRLGG